MTQNHCTMTGKRPETRLTASVCPYDLFRQPEATSSTPEVTVRDVIITGNDVISLAATGSDVMSAGSGVITTGNDVMSLVATESDVITTGCDVVTTGNDVISL